MSDLERRYQGKVKVIRINIDDPQAQAALKKYDVRGTPTIVVLDARGRVVANVPGFPGEAALARALDNLVAQP